MEFLGLTVAETLDASNIKGRGEVVKQNDFKFRDVSQRKACPPVKSQAHLKVFEHCQLSSGETTNCGPAPFIRYQHVEVWLWMEKPRANSKRSLWQG